MKMRKGMGKGKGSGWKNLRYDDSRRHSLASNGIKTAQPNIEGLVRQAQIKGKQTQTQAEMQKEGQFFDVEQVGKEEQPKGISDIDKIGAKTKTEAFVKRTAETGKKALEFARKKLQAQKDKKAMEKIKLLEEIDHPVTQKLDRQMERVAELKQQIALNEDEAREDELFTELRNEENQLREVQEDATELQLMELSDAELKTLAVRYNPSTSVGFIADFIGVGGDNPYQAELVRRVKKVQEVDQQVAQARKEANTGQGQGKDAVGEFFSDFFSP